MSFVGLPPAPTREEIVYRAPEQVRRLDAAEKAAVAAAIRAKIEKRHSAAAR